MGKKPILTAVFLTGVVAFAAVGFSAYRTPLGETRGILGGPGGLVPEDFNGLALAAANQRVVILSGQFGRGGASDYSPPPPDTVSAASAVDAGQPPGPPGGRDGLFVYKIQKGDTLLGIASYFGISLDTIVNANLGVKARFIQPGDELYILPVSGTVYNTKEGDTLESIAAYFGVSESSIVQFNSVDFGSLGVGVQLIIPGVKSFSSGGAGFAGSLPSFGANFMKPTQGFNWGRLHNYNAVDIANVCGTPVAAAAEGLVVPDKDFGDGSDGGWNGGYGGFVLVEHPFGKNVRTRYAHLQSVKAGIGDYVKQGQIIGEMGQSGEASGCHLHFEVYGAENPFAK